MHANYRMAGFFPNQKLFVTASWGHTMCRMILVGIRPHLAAMSNQRLSGIIQLLRKDTAKFHLSSIHLAS